MSEEFEVEKLDSPLIVHKATDASYSAAANAVEVEATHTDDKSANLVRHRFRRVKRRSKAPYFIIAAVVIVAVFCGLYFGGVIGNREEPTEPDTSSSGYLESTTNRFSGIITIKGSYVFFEGEEVNGIEGLERRVKYLDAGTEFVVQDEDADPDFLNDEILPILSNYGIKYEVSMVISSGLKSQYEADTEAQSSASSEPSAQAE